MASAPPAAGSLAALLPQLSTRATKRTVDTIFLAHAAFAFLFGLVAFLLPHVWEFFMVHHAGEQLRFMRSGKETRTDDQKVTHLVIRLYGALCLGNAWIVFSARKISEPSVRRALVQAYSAVFALMTLALLRASMTEGGSFSFYFSAANIVAFGALAACYGFFAWLQPMRVFEGLGRSES